MRIQTAVLIVTVLGILVIWWGALQCLFVEIAAIRMIEATIAKRAYRQFSVIGGAAIFVCTVLVGVFALYYETVEPLDKHFNLSCVSSCDWRDFWYFSLLTFLGNGDIGAKSSEMRLVVSIEILTGLVSVVLLLAIAVAFAQSYAVDSAESIRQFVDRLSKIGRHR